MEKKIEESDFMLGELTWQEAKQRFTEVDIALLPVGSTEQHGPHLPLDTDAFDAHYLARAVSSAMDRPRPLVLPLIPYGVSYHHMEFSGTISIGNETLTRLVYDVGMSVARHGIRKLVIVNGHGGNSPALQNAAQMINRDARIFTCVDTGETSDVDVGRIIETPNDAHAGELETSTALAARPHLVRMDRLKKSVPRFSSRYLNFSTSRSVEWYTQTERISRNGVLGDPTRATVEKGERLWQVMVDHLVRFVKDLRDLTLDEIYEKRY
jgi:mycofactocin system creatininase family protein